MKLTNLVLLMLALTFLPFSEGLLARSPRWKRLADAIPMTPQKVRRWRAASGVRRELGVVEIYFAAASLVSGLVLAGAIAFGAPTAMLAWSSVLFMFCLCAALAFNRRFKPAAPPLAPILGFSLFGPLIYLVLERAAPRSGEVSQALWVLRFLPYTALEVAGILFLLFAAVVVAYFIFAWVLLPPFAYGVLVGLKGSRELAQYVTRRFRRNWLRDLSVSVQILGMVYLCWVGVV